MADFKIRGVVPPVTVPDTDDHQLDVPSFERVINRMIDAGVDGLFFLGSTGEVVFWTDERRDQIVREAVRIVDHRVPVLVGIIESVMARLRMPVVPALIGLAGAVASFVLILTLVR